MQALSRKFYLFIFFCVLVSFQLNQVSISDATSLSTSNSSILWEITDQPDYMDPHKNYEYYGSWVQYNIYETLFTYSWDSQNTNPTEPLLATTVDISADGLTYTFILRQGVTFHDGTPFNATCVQMNFWRMLGRGWDDGFGPVWMIAEPILGGQAIEDAVFEYGERSPEHIAAWTNWVDNVAAVVVTGDYEVEIHLSYPFAPFLAALTHPVGSMISPSYFMHHGGMSPGSSDYTLDTQACGTGPYILDKWILDDRIDLKLNEQYWRADAAKATHPNAGAVTDVTLKLNTDSNSRILNLQAGFTDACEWPTSKAYQVWNNVTLVGDGTVQSLNPNLKVWAGYPTFDMTFFGFNLNLYLNVSGEIRDNPFVNWELRAAISYAFDYRALINNDLNNLGVQLQGPIPMGMFAHYNDLYMFEHDMTNAVTRWNNAMANGLDTILANNSYELNIYYNAGNSGREAASHLVKDAIQNIISDPSSSDPSSSLTINVQALEWANYLYLLRNRYLPIFFDNWTPDYADPSNCITPIVKTTGVFANRIGLVGSLGEGGVVWDAPTVDLWIADAAQETDPSTRVTLYQQIQEAIVAHCAYIWGYQAASFHVESASMNGYVFNPMHAAYFYQYYKLNVTTTTTTTSQTTSTGTTSTGTSTGLDGGELNPLTFAIAVGSSIVILIVIVLIYRTRRTL